MINNEIKSLYPKVYVTEQNYKKSKDKMEYAFALTIQNLKNKNLNVGKIVSMCLQK